MYAKDGAIPSKTPAPGNPFIGRIKATSVPPRHTVQTVRCSIARVEDIKDPSKTTLFVTPYCQSPMRNADKVTTLNCKGLRVLVSMPQEPLASDVTAWARLAYPGLGSALDGSGQAPKTSTLVSLVRGLITMAVAQCLVMYSDAKN